MKSRSRELLDKSIGAMISAIEVYNKPSFRYREETFSVLAVNAWELLLKAKWLQEHNNDIRSLYQMVPRRKANGEPSKRMTPRLTPSGNPYTFPIRHLMTKLGEDGFLAPAAVANLDVLVDIRDSAIHFYNQNVQFAMLLQEVGCAAVKNFAVAVEQWFEVTLSEFNFYLMPIAFLTPHDEVEAVPLNRSEANLANYIAYLDKEIDTSGDFSIAVTMSVKFDRSPGVEGMKVRLSNDEDAMPVRFSDEQMKSRYPYVYKKLSEACRKRYSDFQENQKYHDIRKSLKGNSKYCHTRSLDPSSPKSAKQDWYSEAVFTILDEHYTRRKLNIKKRVALEVVELEIVPEAGES